MLGVGVISTGSLSHTRQTSTWSLEKSGLHGPSGQDCDLSGRCRMLRATASILVLDPCWSVASIAARRVASKTAVVRPAPAKKLWKKEKTVLGGYCLSEPKEF